MKIHILTSTQMSQTIHISDSTYSVLYMFNLENVVDTDYVDEKTVVVIGQLYPPGWPINLHIQPRFFISMR